MKEVGLCVFVCVCVCVCICVCVCVLSVCFTNSRELEHPRKQGPPVKWSQQQSGVLPHATVLFTVASRAILVGGHGEDDRGELLGWKVDPLPDQAVKGRPCVGDSALREQPGHTGPQETGAGEVQGE